MQLVMFLLFTLSQLPNTALEFKYDEGGKIVFMEVVNTKVGYDTLVQNIENLGFTLHQDGGERQGFNKEESFMLYDKRLSKVPHGELSFNVEVEIKEGKFRYVIGDLIFHEFVRNRYGRFEEKKNGQVPLEEVFENLNKDWKVHQSTILNKLNRVIENIKSQMTNLPETVEEQKTIKVNDNW